MQPQHQLLVASTGFFIVEPAASSFEVQELQSASGTISTSAIPVAPLAELALIIDHIAQHSITALERAASCSGRRQSSFRGEHKSKCREEKQFIVIRKTTIAQGRREKG